MVKKFKNIFYIKELLIWTLRLTKNVDPAKYKYSGCVIGFDSLWKLSWTYRSMAKNVIILGADMSLSVNTDNRNKNILILGEGPTQGLDDATLRAEAKYPINFTKQRKDLLMIFLLINANKIYKFKAKEFEIKNYTLYLGKVSKDFTTNNTKTSMIKRKYIFLLLILILLILMIF